MNRGTGSVDSSRSRILSTTWDLLSSIHDPICPRLPACVYAEELQSRGRKPTLHVFRSIRQRDGWVDMDSVRRVAVKPTDARIAKAWDRLDLTLHAVDIAPLKL